MKNREKYAEDIKNSGGGFCEKFIKPIVFKQDNCLHVDCEQCHMLCSLWLDEEAEEAEEAEAVEAAEQVDWSKVAVDTPILVKSTPNEKWIRRYFAYYEEGSVYAFDGGKTSWSANNNIFGWTYAKLAESEAE